MASNHFRLQMIAVRNTFIHFHESFPRAPRSMSAPAKLKSTPTTPEPPIKKKKRKQKKQDNDTRALEEFRREVIKDKWLLLTTKLRARSQWESRSEINTQRLHLILPRYLFDDWAFFCFHISKNQEGLQQLFDSRILRTRKASVEFWYSHRQLRDRKCTPSPQNLLTNAVKLLQAQDMGLIGAFFNRDIFVYHVWDAGATIHSIVAKTLQVMNTSGSASARHRARLLQHKKTLSELGIQPGSVIMINVTPSME